jgi:bacterial leucyl aminopeptidase
MKTKNLGAIALWLACATPAFAGGEDKAVWITVGTDALEPVRASLLREGTVLPAVAHEKDGVAVLRVRESQLERLSETIHSKLNRCAGFVAHDNEAQARAALERLGAPEMSPSLVSYTIDNPTTAKSLVGGITESGIRGIITSLSTNFTSRRYTLTSGAQAATWLKNQWTTLANGRSDISVELYAHSSSVSPQPSVILTIQGTTASSEVVVLGGHLDSINSSGSSASAPGADDDASGVASLTEVIRVIVAKNYRPLRTVKFMAYAAEEGGLRGSKDIAAKYKSTSVNVVGVLQLDMTNYHGSSADIVLVSDYTTAAQNTFLTNLAKQYLPSGTAVSTTRCGYACSDHASWYNQGYPASIPFEAFLGEDNPRIHTSSDTLAQMGNSAQNSVKFSQLAAAYVAELAKGTATVP